LRESDLPLREVAELLGFARLSSFSHWFRAHFGCSASQWAQQADAEAGT
jgi:AraC-like DNA-binding protein